MLRLCAPQRRRRARAHLAPDRASALTKLTVAQSAMRAAVFSDFQVSEEPKIGYLDNKRAVLPLVVNGTLRWAGPVPLAGSMRSQRRSAISCPARRWPASFQWPVPN